jgi:hypothetical protein
LRSKAAGNIKSLSDISIQSIVLSFQKFLLDQAIDVPLDAADFQCSPVLGCRYGLTDQFGMADSFPRLEDPDNGSLCLVVTVSSNAFVCLLVLGCRFLELNGVDLDAVLRIRE